jgi:hypothetical protein
MKQPAHAASGFKLRSDFDARPSAVIAALRQFLAEADTLKSTFGSRTFYRSEMIVAFRPPYLSSLKDVEDFAGRADSRFALPNLVRRLVFQTNTSLSVVQMSGDEDTDTGGFDGIVVAATPTPFVPEGRSVWELSVRANPKQKADEDYTKRTANALGEVQSETTFVFATARAWPGANDWVRERKAEGVWKDVVVFTAADFHSALELAPAADIWFSNFIDKPASSVSTLEHWWEKWTANTRGLLTPELVLLGREATSASLLRVFVDEDHSLTWLKAKNVDEVLAFVAATLLAAPETTREQFLPRALVVHEPGVIRFLENSSELLILVPFEESLTREAELAPSHHVLMLSSGGAPSTIELGSIPIDESAGILDSAVDRDLAREYARDLFRSVTRFRRKVLGQPVAPFDASLGNDDDARVARRAWLLGRWNVNRSGDVRALETISGGQAERSDDVVARLASGADPVFAQVGPVWAAIDPAESFNQIGAAFIPSDLDAFRDVVQEVLGAVDPALELPASERWYASVKGKSREHSSDLRKGLSSTLATMAALGADIRVSSVSLRGWSELLVRALLQRANGDATGELWVSMADVLPILAEASPDDFLSELDKATEPKGPFRTQMFGVSEGFMSSTSPHVYVVWALERLAWSSTYFGAAILALAKLSSFQPASNTKMGNLPSSALVSVFRLWLPQTTASLEERESAIELLQEKYTQVATDLVFSLLPERNGVGEYTNGPKFRDWKPKEQLSGLPSDYPQSVERIITVAISMAVNSPERWAALIHALPDLPVKSWTEIEVSLEGLAASSPAERVRVEVWSALTSMARQNREYSTAGWAMPEHFVERIDRMAHPFEPVAAIDRDAWLFDYNPWIGVSVVDDFESYSQKLSSLQEASVAAIAVEQGIDELRDLAGRVKNPWAVGYAFAAIATDAQIDWIAQLLGSETPVDLQFATAAIRRRSGADLSRLAPLASQDEMSPLAQARVLSIAENLQATWEVLPTFAPEVEQTYWAEFQIGGRGADLPNADEIAAQLARHGRPATGLSLLSLYSSDETKEVDAERIVELFDQVISERDPQTKILSPYDIQRLLEVVKSSGSIDEDVIVTLEWQLLPAFQYDEVPEALQRRLASVPGFFAEIISLAYLPRNGEPDREVVEGQATNAWRLLHNWKIIPGSTSVGGDVAQDELRQWIKDARSLLTQSDRVEVGDLTIGQVLSHSKIDGDDMWPTLAVRNVIETEWSEQLTRGFQTQTFNNRGLVSRSLTAGGAQEIKLAERYEGWAQRATTRWPKTAAALRAIAEGYRVDAARNDDDSERFVQGLDG